MTLLLEKASNAASPVELRLVKEYGAVFSTAATPPPKILFAGSQEVVEFQARLHTGKAVFGDYEVELQTPAVEALSRASAELAAMRKGLSARAADSGRRSYDETVALWLRNVNRGLDHWVGENRLDSGLAGQIRQLAPVAQVPVILELEERESLYFGTFFDRSILYSVAAPGASQHLSLLAFDVAEYQDREVEEALNRHGWYRTVTSDLPHFTYLGHREDDLQGLGLKLQRMEYETFSVRFWIPDLDAA